ncbi:MAG TPA: MFS transporter [Ignavibacteriales bacterium]|nr:MFS transporter [Ignavibacteriales bacterium]
MNKSSWKFPTAFWTANIVELFERAAYYGVFIAITLYLSRIVGFDDIEAAWIGGIFSAGLYFLPPFTGALADKIGFRNAVILAFALLSLGYFSLGAFPYKAVVLPSLVVLMFGGSFIKSIITGTVAKTTTPQTRAKGYSIFYGIVNIGAFLGKTFAYPLRIEWGLTSINFFSALMSFIALIVVVFFYKNVSADGEGKSVKDVWTGFVKVVSNMRLLTLIFIVTGFWIIQHQLYATMPKYVLRTVGEQASPEWIANVNPAVVMALVMFITHLMRNVKAVSSMAVGMFLMPVSALLMASSNLLESFTGESVSILGLFSAHPITVMMIAGIMVQGLAECFISPRYLEYFSLQAPKGEEGLYLGFSHLHSFLSSILGFGISGYLLTAYAPDPATLSPAQLLTAYDKSYMIWYYFAAIGLTAAIALLVYRWYYQRKDLRTAVN